MDQNRDASTKNLLGAIHASSDPKKWAFLQATYSCPELIELESPPMVFLEHSGFDQRNAANRLINYWDLRVMTFGTDRAFRSVLNLSGTQALSPVAVEYLSTGFASFLPRDDQGRTILFLDRSLIPTHLVHIDIGIRHEATFYALSKAMQNNTRRLIAIIFFTIKPQFFPGSARWFLNAIAQAFPLQLDAGVIACRSPRSAYKRFVATFVPVILRLISAELSRFNITIDIGEKEDLLKKLIQRGMVADHLPVDVGGTWKGVGGIYSLQHEGDGSCNGLELLVAAVEMDASLFSSPAPLDTNADECSIIQRSPDIHDSTVMALQNPQDDTNDVPPFQEDSQATSMDWSTIVQAVACLPPLDIAAFVEASSVAMDRMKAESNLNVFLTLENGDVNAAAKRVASYWKVRKMFFMDRAFLPLNQTGGKKQTSV